MFKKNNFGFLLEDALISVMVTCVLSTVVCMSVLSHYHVEESVEKQCLESKEETNITMQGIDACVICTENADANGSINEESY